MDVLLLALFGVLCAAVWAQQPALQCKDADTSSCEGFHKAKPDLCDDPTFSQSMCKRHCGNCPLECYSCPHPVRHPSDCNTTETCGPNMTCLTKHLRAVDGHHEYVMRCESKEVCNILIDGFGKRKAGEEDDLIDVDMGRFERDVILNCCDTDLCNFEVERTTPITTSTTTTTTAAPIITTTQRKACNKDIVFVIEDYQNPAPDSWQHFLEQIISKLDVGPVNTQIAVVLNAKDTWDLDKYRSKADIVNALRYLLNSHHSTVSTRSHIDDAVKKVTGHVFQDNNGDRVAAENVVVILEYGRPHDIGRHSLQAAHDLHAASHNVVTVGVGQAVAVSELHALATDSRHSFTEPSFQDLQRIVPDVLNLICA